MDTTDSAAVVIMMIGLLAAPLIAIDVFAVIIPVNQFGQVLSSVDRRDLRRRAQKVSRMGLAAERAVAVAEQIKPAGCADFGLLSGYRRRRHGGDRRQRRAL